MSSISVHLYSKGAAAQQCEPGQARQDQDNNNRQHLSNVNKQRHVILGLPLLEPSPACTTVTPIFIPDWQGLLNFKDISQIIIGMLKILNVVINICGNMCGCECEAFDLWLKYWWLMTWYINICPHFVVLIVYIFTTPVLLCDLLGSITTCYIESLL